MQTKASHMNWLGNLKTGPNSNTVIAKKIQGRYIYIQCDSRPAYERLLVGPIKRRDAVREILAAAADLHKCGDLAQAVQLYRRLNDEHSKWRYRGAESDVAMLYQDFGVALMNMGRVGGDSSGYRNSRRYLDGFGAIECFEKAELLFGRTNNQARALHMKGVSLGIRDKRSEALAIYLGLESNLKSDTNERQLLAQVYRDIGINLSNEAFEHYKLGYSLSSIESFSNARSYLKRSAQAYDRLMLPDETALTELESSKLEAKARRPKEAAKHLYKSVAGLDRRQPLSDVKFLRAEYLLYCVDRDYATGYKYAQIEKLCNEHGFSNERKRLKRYQTAFQMH